ncbi:hypothetical protein ATE92_1746 [Ulvibacter sp. MAR_2010_11]|nr:hypothetical protein ATE92_1746 [Ulvibacter sp. MAR_2010_11]
MQNLVTAKEAATILKCTRTNVERLQLTKKLIPASTPFCKYYFNREDVLNLKALQEAKRTTNV